MFRSCLRSEFVRASAAPAGRWPSVASIVLALLAGLGMPEPARAQGQTTVTIAPSSRVIVGVDTVQVTVLWCGYPPNLFDPDSRSIKVNGVDVTSNFDLEWDPVACGFYGEVSDELFYKSTGTITLSSPSSTVTADVWDWSRTYLYSAPSKVYKIPDPRRRVVVVAEAQFREVRPNTAQTQRFTVYNSGPVRDTFAISRTCTGWASGCGLSASSVPLDAGQSTTVTVSDSSHAAGDTASVTLRAARNADATFADSSWTDVKVTAGASSGVAIVGTAPGVNGTVERSLCVTVAAGDDAAVECGDLRLVHALPSVRTLGTQRTPTLLYNSQHARPKPLIVADVTLPTTGQVPDTVRAVILVGGVARGTASWLGTQWGSLGATRRIVVPADASSFWDTVRICTYKLQVRYIWGNDYSEDTSVTQHLPVVNRAHSPFGAGWWLAGLERLEVMSGTQLEWIGGDGSARVYTKDGANNVYRTSSLTRPDTIVADDTSYVRYAAGGAKVWFTAAGSHFATVNRLGRRTDFVWNGAGRLDTLKVPTLGSPLTYIFNYTSGTYPVLSTVSAPGSRTTTVYASSSNLQVDSIKDPDNHLVRFTYGTGSNQLRVATRTDRRGHVTTYTWDDAAQRLTQVQRPLSITTNLVFAETKGLATAVVVDSAYTSIDGPRTDVGDTTRIWINGHGAPTRIRNALGRETLISYDATWPGLAAVTKGPSGLRTRAWYNGRGLPDSTIVYNPLGTGQNAVRRYQWHARWEALTKDSTPTGLVTTFDYDTVYGNRQWEQVGPSQTRRVSYHYNADRLLDQVVLQADTQRLAYDSTLGNLRSNQTPRGFTSYAYGDAIGRDTLTVSSLDTLPQTSLRTLRTRTYLSTVDRVDSVRTWSADSAHTPQRTHRPDTVLVKNVYDAEGNREETGRYFRSRGQEWALRSFWAYDDANRDTSESNPGAGVRTTLRDAAGNVTSILSPRGHTVAVSYDELNRPIRRILSQVDYANIGCPAFGGDCELFTFPTREGSSVCLASDTSTFDYDAAGNLRRADNGWAWVRRAYTPSGLLTHDTLVIRTYETSAPYPCGDGDRHSGGVVSSNADFTTHVYALRLTYDLEGRRDSLLHPNGIDFCSGQCATRYAYESATGLLSTVTDPLGYTTSFAYDAAGRDTATTYPGGVVMRRSYDHDGGVVGRHGPFTNGDTLRLDAQGRLSSGTIGDIADNGEATIRLRYGPLGAVIYAENLTAGASYEEDSVDTIGNRTWQREYGVRPDYTDRNRRLYLDNTTGRLDSIKLVAPLPEGWMPDSSIFVRNHIALYDGAGNSHQTYGWPNPTLTGSGWEAVLEEAVSYFDAEERLRIFNRHADYGQVSGSGGVYEEYRYDALGRRVLVRSRCTAASSSSAYCRGYVERTVWDGDQVLYEIRAPGQDSASAEAMENDAYAGASPATSYDALLGRVGYVHAQGIDAPLAVYRMGMAGQPSPIGVAPHANFQGVFEIGSMIGGSYSGQSTRDCQGYSGCPTIHWPGGNTTIDGDVPVQTATQTWFGNLLSQKADGSGLQYMRNRYYDPRTGRFTQADPIGLAGGLNLYGFASGDPVNFGDPFGLRACCKLLGEVWNNFKLGMSAWTDPSVGDNGGPGFRTGLAVGFFGMLLPGLRVGGGVEAGTAVSTIRRTAAGETFEHYGYAEEASSFAGGMRANGYATRAVGLSGKEAQSTLALPRALPPDASFTVTPAPGTLVRVNPAVKPANNQLGRGSEVEFLLGTGPGTVGPPKGIR